MTKRKSSMPKPINPKDFLSKEFLEKRKRTSKSIHETNARKC